MGRGKVFFFTVFSLNLMTVYNHESKKQVKVITATSTLWFKLTAPELKAGYFCCDAQYWRSSDPRAWLSIFTELDSDNVAREIVVVDEDSISDSCLVKAAEAVEKGVLDEDLSQAQFSNSCEINETSVSPNSKCYEVVRKVGDAVVEKHELEFNPATADMQYHVSPCPYGNNCPMWIEKDGNIVDEQICQGCAEELRTSASLVKNPPTPPPLWVASPPNSWDSDNIREHFEGSAELPIILDQSHDFDFSFPRWRPDNDDPVSPNTMYEFWNDPLDYEGDGYPTYPEYKHSHLQNFISYVGRNKWEEYRERADYDLQREYSEDELMMMFVGDHPAEYNEFLSI